MIRPILTAAWYAAGWAIFGLGYTGAIVLVTAGPHASAASAILVLTAGARLSSYVGATVSEIGFLRGTWMDGARRLAWLEDYAAAVAQDTDLPAPGSITEGIRFEHVTFRYPGSDRAALDDVDLFLPAGAVVAVVGENGAGETTLVKLLAKLYAPSAGRILVDGADLARVDSAPGRGTSFDGLPAGLRTQLGPTWADGVDVSYGQWQKLALARGFMRDEPLLVALDEPTAALDAETEHQLFERYAGRAREARRSRRNGSVTILVSHRFSTVRMADLIVVLDGARVAETGSHDELLARGGRYAELYQIQARAYQ